MWHSGAFSSKVNEPGSGGAVGYIALSGLYLAICVACVMALLVSVTMSSGTTTNTDVMSLVAFVVAFALVTRLVATVTLQKIKEESGESGE